MTLTLPRRLNNGDDGDADNLMEIIDALADAFPVTDTNQSAISASKVTIPSGFAWPASTIPSSVISDAGATSALHYLNSDPQFIRAYGMPFVRRMPLSSWAAPSGGGFPAPIRDGALFPSRTNDRVYEIPRNSTGGQDSLFTSQITHTFSSGDKPVHAVAKDQSQAYVLCQGNSGNPHPSIKIINTGSTGGAATAWLSLGATYTSVRHIAINRQGSYLYVTAKRSGDTNHRRVLRIDTSTLAVSECNTAADYDITTVFVAYQQGGGASELGTVWIGSLGGDAARIEEAAGAAYGGAFPSTPSGTHSIATSIYSGGLYRGKPFFVSHQGTTLTIDVFGREYTEADPTGASGFHSSTSSTSTPNPPVVGGAATDGRVICALLSDGGMKTCDPLSSDEAATFTPGQHNYGGATTMTDYCGLAFTGKHMVGFFHKTSDGTGYMFSF